MYGNKLWRLSMKLGKKNSKMTILGANETMAKKPWCILKIALNKKVILNNKNLNLENKESALQQEWQV